MAFFGSCSTGKHNDPDYVRIVRTNDRMRRSIEDALKLLATKRALGADETAEIKVLLREAIGN